MKKIFETAVYCGRMKEWRILNISTGTVYSSDFETEEAALNAIEHGKERAGCIVQRIRLRDLHVLLSDLNA